MKTFKSILIIVLVCAHTKIIAQITDTVSLNKVEIFDEKKLSKIEILPTKQLGQALKQQDFIFIKEYGPGLLNTVTLRGLGANHTSIMWEGISLNNTMLGSADLSLIPLGLFAEADKLEGENLLLTTNGNFGGGYNLKNTIPTNLKVTFNSSYNFYSDARLNVGFEDKIKRFTYGYNFFSLYSNNRFKFYNPYTNAIEHREHALQKGIGQMIRLGYDFNSHNRIEANYWLQKVYRQLPSPVGVNNNTEYQTDFFNRLLLKFLINYTRFKLINVTGLLDDSLNYYNPLAWGNRYKSLNRTLTFRNNLKADFFYSQYVSLCLSHQSELLQAFTTNYWVEANRYFNQYILISPSVYFHHFKINFIYKPSYFGLQKAWFSVYNVSPFIQINSKISLGGNWGNNVRFPTLNDLFWIPGGNEKLLPEIGHLKDAYLTFTPFTNTNNTLTFKITGYYNKVYNYIQWLPLYNVQYFSPVNISVVTLKGTELLLKTQIKCNRFSFKNETFYAYTLSKPTTGNGSFYPPSAKQLLYTPIYNLKNNSEIQIFNQVGFIADYQLVSWRAVSTDNYDYLPWYQLVDVGISKQFLIHKNKLNLRFMVNNLFNVRYFVVANRPMPLRNYLLGINYIFEK